MATREERIRVSILGADDGKRDLDRLARASDGLGDEFKDLARDAGVLDRKMDGLRDSQRKLASEFARTGDADIGKKLRLVTAQIGDASAARKALVGDLEHVLDEADRASERRAKAEKRRFAEMASAANKAADAAKKAADASRQDLRRRVGRLGSAARTAAGPVGLVAGGASLAGPAVSGMLALGKATAAFGRQLLTLPPLLAAVPAAIGGFALFVGTLKLAGPALGKALTPIGEAFKGIRDRIGAIAAKGLPEFARGFAKVNFPSISKAMEGIAGSLNRVLVNTGKWVNSASGQQAIRQITEATADAAKRLEGPISRVVVSFGEMVKRIGGRPIAGIAAALERAANATTRWMDSLDNTSLDRALGTLSMWGGKLKDTFIAIRDVGRWMAENEDAVKRFSDTVAGLAIVLGVATGNWLAVLAGAFSLAVNHWEGAKRVFAGIGEFFSNLWNGIRNDPNVRGLFDSVKAAVTGFVDSFKHAFAKLDFDVTIRALKRAWEEWAPILKAWWDGVGKPVFSLLGTALAGLIAGILAVTTGAAIAFAVLSQALKAFVSGALTVFGTFINGAAKAFGWMPGIGPKLQKAADDFNKFRDRVNTALAGIKDEDVKINVRVVGGGADVIGGKSSSGQVRFAAAGGRFSAGEVAVVGEQGPELVKFAGSAEVLSNARSMRAFNRGGGGAQTVDLRVSGDDSWLYKAIMNGLRTGQIQAYAGGNRVSVR